jgi:hypothetical protein
MSTSDPPPIRPIEPDAMDCCGGGCTSCVFDLYQIELEKYQAALDAWRARRHEQGGHEQDRSDA